MYRPLADNNLGIVIPARNEEKRIGRTLEGYLGYFNLLKDCKDIKDYEILAVLNDTRDNSPKIIKNYQKENNRLTVLDILLPGKGRAIYSGFKYCLRKNYDLIGFVDADASTSPEEFYKLALSINNFSGAIASRYLKESRVNPKQSLKRVIASRIFNLWVRMLLNLPYKDTQCGAKIFKKDSLSKVIEKTISDGWTFDIDLLYQMKRSGYSIIEVPTVWEDKEGSQFKVFSSGLTAARDVLKLRLRTPL